MCNHCVMENVKQSMLSRRSLFKGMAVAGAAVTAGGIAKPVLAEQSPSKVIDLTHAYDGSFPTFDGKPGIEYEWAVEFAGNGYQLHKLTIFEHTGTHIDAPFHFSADGKSVIAGNLYDAQGNDLSSAPLETLVYAPMAKEVWAKMEKSSWIQDGDTNAPRTVYLFSDPNCPYCNMFWEQARPWVKAGKVQLRHIMVGIIREDSAAKSAALFAAKDPQKALEEHEAAGKGSKLQALAKIREMSTDHALEYAQLMLATLARTQDAKEGFAAFIEKRPPAWLAPAQGGGGHAADVRVAHGLVAVEGGHGARGAQQGEVAAQAVGAQRGAQRADALAHGVGDGHVGQALARGGDLLADALVVFLPALDEGGAVLLVRVAAAHHLHAVGQVVGRFDLHRQAEAVEQLRAQFAFFGVAAAHQHEARGVAHRQALALDHVLARGRHVDQQVDQVVLEQVHLVDIEQAAVGLGQQARLKRLFAPRQRAFDVQGPHDTVFGRAQGQVDHRSWAFADAARNGIGPSGHILDPRRVDRAAFNRRNLGQQSRKGAHGGGFSGATVTKHQHAADAGVDGGQYHGLFHGLLADNGREGERLAHAASFVAGVVARGRWPPHVPQSSIRRKRA